MIDENIDYKKWRKISKATVEKRNKFVTTFPINRNGRVIKCQLGYFWRPRWFQAGKEWSYELSLARTVLHWYSLWFVGKVSGFFFHGKKTNRPHFSLVHIFTARWNDVIKCQKLCSETICRHFYMIDMSTDRGKMRSICLVRPYLRDRLTSCSARTRLSPAIGPVIWHNTLNSERKSRAISQVIINGLQHDNEETPQTIVRCSGLIVSELSYWFEHWLASLCCVPGQATLLSPSLALHWSINGCVIVNTNLQNTMGSPLIFNIPKLHAGLLETRLQKCIDIYDLIKRFLSDN